MAQPPVIVVPGITATTLSDYYPLPPEELWTAVLAKKYQRIALHPDDVRYEAVEPARVQPENVFALVYGDLIDALRHDLSEKRDLPTPVFGFAYDWRQDCSRSAEQLSSFIDEVLTRTALLPHYQDKTFRVDLVGHSMGGLIIADYLARYGQEKKVRRVVSIGSPFEGSLDAVLKLTIGKGTLTGESPRDREREAARTIPAIYQLLPTFKGAVRAAQGLSADLFSVETWQPSILQTLGEYIRLHKARTKARSLFKQYLDGAKRFRERIRQVDLQGVLPEGKKGWLPIVGVGSPTQVRVKISRWHEKPWFEVEEDQNNWPEGTDTGDGTVPFEGACPTFLARRQLVCISPDDFSRWEVRDRVMAKTAGFHAVLPNVNLIQRLTVRFLRPKYDGDVWGRVAPGIKRPGWPTWVEVRRK